MIARHLDMGLAALALLAALTGGAVGTSEIWFLMLAVASVGVWAWRRQRPLGEVTMLQRAVRGIAAYAMIGFALLAAFELGQFLGGHT